MGVVVILPLAGSDYFIWTFMGQRGQFISDLVMAFPIIAAPLLVAATYTRQRGLHCGLIGVTVLLQYGFLVYYLMASLDRILIFFGGSSVFLFAQLGCFCCLLVGVAGLAGRLSGATGPVWRWTSAGGGAGIAGCGFAIYCFGMQQYASSLSYIVVAIAGVLAVVIELRPRLATRLRAFILVGYALGWLLTANKIMFMFISAHPPGLHWQLRGIATMSLASLFLMSLFQFMSPDERGADPPVPVGAS